MPTLRDHNAAATRAALIQTAAGLFAERGYGAVSTTDVVTAAQMTRGAMYHHFKDKPALMRAVFEHVEHDLVATVSAAASTPGTARERLDRTWRAFLDAIGDPITRAIVFVEAPAALGWQEWRSIDAGRSLAVVVDLLRQLQDDGNLDEDRDVVVLGHLVMGAINEAGMLIAAARRPKHARRAAETELVRFFNALLSQT